MTTDKARKRAVRSRMRKTGERYAAARRHVARPVGDPTASSKPAVLQPPVAPEAILPEAGAPAPAAAPAVDLDPGWPDETIRKGTGRDWAHWLPLLDQAGAAGWSHTEIARWLVATQDITGWWAQTVTVGYERARGRRALHQTSRGFEVSVAKTIRAPLDAVWAALNEPDGRRRWIEDGILEPTTARDRVAARFAVPESGAAIELYVEAKRDDRTTVTAAVRKLRDGDDVEAQRLVWRDRLRRLEQAVTDPRGPAPSAPTVARTSGRPS